MNDLLVWLVGFSFLNQEGAIREACAVSLRLSSNTPWDLTKTDNNIYSF